MTELLIIFFCLFPSDPKGVPVIKGKNTQSHLKFTETVDKIEINTCYADFTQEFNRWKVPVYVPSYQQVIFYDWSPEYQRYHVKDWVMIASLSTIFSNKPVYYYKIFPIMQAKGEPRNKWYGGLEPEFKAQFSVNKTEEYYVVTVNIEGNKHIVQSKILDYTETDTADDPEKINKKVFDEKYRNHLAKPSQKIK